MSYKQSKDIPSYNKYFYIQESFEKIYPNYIKNKKVKKYWAVRRCPDKICYR